MVGGENLLLTCLIIGSTARVLTRGPCAITAAKALLAVRGFSMPDHIGTTTVAAAYSIRNHTLSLPEQPKLCHYRKSFVVALRLEGVVDVAAYRMLADV